jgi:hypothetical protein
MRTKISPRLTVLAHKFSKIPLVKPLLKPIYYPYKKSIQDNRNLVFRQNALKVFKEFDEILTINNIHYSVFAGTLLGAIREKGFIKHDLDIDTCIWYKDFTPRIREVLEDHGFKLVGRFEVDGGSKASEETYQKEGVDIDIFYIYSDDKYPSYQCDFKMIDGTASYQKSMKKFGYVNVRRIEFPVSYEVVRVPFENIEVNILSNADEWLTARYGVDYITSNPGFHDTGSNPRMFDWVGVKAIYMSGKDIDKMSKVFKN